MLSKLAHHYRHTRKTYDPTNIDELAMLAGAIMEVVLEITGSQHSDTDQLEKCQYFMSRAWQLHSSLALSDLEVCQSAAIQLESHLNYAGERLGSQIKKAEAFERSQSAVFCDCLINCISTTVSIFKYNYWSCPDPREVTEFFESSVTSQTITDEANILIQQSRTLEGWCSQEKSMLLYTLIREYKPTTAVEIGVYGGSSIIPIAAGLKDNGFGAVYGIETWSGETAIKYRTNIANDFWWMSINLEEIKERFLRFIVDHRLCDAVKLIECSSDVCSTLFDKIDFLHIDGGHSAFGSTKDVVNYASRVPPGGIIVYDDINWSSTSAGLEVLRDSCSLLHVTKAFDSDTKPGCAAFIKI
jgi:predicted O-methyltransferase YrrM